MINYLFASALHCSIQKITFIHFNNEPMKQQEKNIIFNMFYDYDYYDYY